MEEAISDKLIDRLTLYHCILSYTVNANEYVSSAEIASLLKIDDSLVRKDIAFCGIQGLPKHGYNVVELKKGIEEKLSFHNKKDVFVVGAGNLGTALTKYADFKDYGINVLALFDSNPDKIGKTLAGITVFSITKLKNLVEQMNIDTIILAVPPQAAQSVADELVAMNIKSIWNFSPCILRVPENVTVHYENIISGFLRLKK